MVCKRNSEPEITDDKSMKNSLLCLLLFSTAAFSAPPELQLSNIYSDDITLQNYWVSEKYDGVRAFWNGKQLISRQGNIIQSPDWFTAPLPQIPLDGELWIARGQFDRLSGIVRHQTPNESDWHKVNYMVFDLPASTQTFDHRLKTLKALINKINRPFIQMVQQEKISSHEILMHRLDAIVDQGGEGLMLHLGSSTYKKYRSNDLLKLKKYDDAEAIVIKHLSGKGKYEGMLGSILVETKTKHRFKIGSGFSDAERKNPPEIGSTITYKYFGLTNNGIPRFASFLRIRLAH
ncbi:MAG: DNA ligase-1 [Gammaproteobacteria bacterium]